MYILNNPILGKVLNKYALVLNDVGLHRRIRIENRTDYFIFLTDDVKKIAEIFALDFQTLCDKRDEEGCEFIKTSPYFSAQVFTYTNPKKSCKYVDMMAKLITEEDLRKDALPIDTTRVMGVLEMPDLIDTINYFKDVLPKAHEAYKENFNKLKQMIIDNGYDVRNFARDLPLFIDSFNDNSVMEILLYEESTEAMYDKFMTISMN